MAPSSESARERRSASSTSSGTNQFHGSAYEFSATARWTREIISTREASRNFSATYSAFLSLGGPIVKGKTFPSETMKASGSTWD